MKLVSSTHVHKDQFSFGGAGLDHDCAFVTDCESITRRTLHRRSAR